MSPAGTEDLVVAKVEDLASHAQTSDVLVLGAGFEDRAFAVLTGGTFRDDSHCVLVRFINDIPGNRKVFDKYLNSAREKFASSNIHVVELRHRYPHEFERDLSKVIRSLPLALRSFTIDISGLPTFAICVALKVVRDVRPEEVHNVVYTSALTYNPPLDEYIGMNAEAADEIELVPQSMALEMDENLILDSFSGYRSHNAKSCLVLFAGYEAHRSTGVVEAINPALLLLLYGTPGDSALAWRLDLSRKLHRKFEKGRRTATEIVSTLQPQEALEVLSRYYNFLIDEYDLVISPINSKMNTVAAYLFWERYPETQITFPIPIGYDPARGPRGISTSYSLSLPPRRSFFSGSAAG